MIKEHTNNILSHHIEINVDKIGKNTQKLRFYGKNISILVNYFTNKNPHQSMIDIKDYVFDNEIHFALWNKIFPILLKSNRNEEEIELIVKFLLNTKLFKKFAMDSNLAKNMMEIKYLCAFLLKYQRILPYENIFKMKDKGDKFYLILKGKVGVFKLKEVKKNMSYKDVLSYIKELIKRNENYILSKVIDSNNNHLINILDQYNSCEKKYTKSNYYQNLKQSMMKRMSNKLANKSKLSEVSIVGKNKYQIVSELFPSFKSNQLNNITDFYSKNKNNEESSNIYITENLSNKYMNKIHNNQTNNISNKKKVIFKNLNFKKDSIHHNKDSNILKSEKNTNSEKTVFSISNKNKFASKKRSSQCSGVIPLINFNVKKEFNTPIKYLDITGRSNISNLNLHILNDSYGEKKNKIISLNSNNSNKRNNVKDKVKKSEILIKTSNDNDYSDSSCSSYKSSKSSKSKSSSLKSYTKSTKPIKLSINYPSFPNKKNRVSLSKFKKKSFLIENLKFNKSHTFNCLDLKAKDEFILKNFNNENMNMNDFHSFNTIQDVKRLNIKGKRKLKPIFFKNIFRKKKAVFSKERKFINLLNLKRRSTFKIEKIIKNKVTFKETDLNEIEPTIKFKSKSKKLSFDSGTLYNKHNKLIENTYESNNIYESNKLNEIKLSNPTNSNMSIESLNYKTKNDVDLVKENSNTNIKESNSLSKNNIGLTQNLNSLAQRISLKTSKKLSLISSQNNFDHNKGQFILPIVTIKILKREDKEFVLKSFIDFVKSKGKKLLNKSQKKKYHQLSYEDYISNFIDEVIQGLKENEYNRSKYYKKYLRKDKISLSNVLKFDDETFFNILNTENIVGFKKEIQDLLIEFKMEEILKFESQDVNNYLNGIPINKKKDSEEIKKIKITVEGLKSKKLDDNIINKLGEYLIENFIFYELYLIIELNSGDYFGDTALDTNGLRNATVSALDEEVHLGYLETKNYKDYIRDEKNKAINSEVSFLMNHFFFKKFNKIKFQRVYFDKFMIYNIQKGKDLSNFFLDKTSDQIYFFRQGHVEISTKSDIFTINQQIMEIIIYLVEIYKYIKKNNEFFSDVIENDLFKTLLYRNYIIRKNKLELLKKRLDIMKETKFIFKNNKLEMETEKKMILNFKSYINKCLNKLDKKHNNNSENHNNITLDKENNYEEDIYEINNLSLSKDLIKIVSENKEKTKVFDEKQTYNVPNVKLDNKKSLMILNSPFCINIYETILKEKKLNFDYSIINEDAQCYSLLKKDFINIFISEQSIHKIELFIYSKNQILNILERLMNVFNNEFDKLYNLNENKLKFMLTKNDFMKKNNIDQNDESSFADENKYKSKNNSQEKMLNNFYYKCQFTKSEFEESKIINKSRVINSYNFNATNKVENQKIKFNNKDNSFKKINNEILNENKLNQFKNKVNLASNLKKNIDITSSYNQSTSIKTNLITNTTSCKINKNNMKISNFNLYKSKLIFQMKKLNFYDSISDKGKEYEKSFDNENDNIKSNSINFNKFPISKNILDKNEKSRKNINYNIVSNSNDFITREMLKENEVKINAKFKDAYVNTEIINLEKNNNEIESKNNNYFVNKRKLLLGINSDSIKRALRSIEKSQNLLFSINKQKRNYISLKKS